MDNEIVLEQEQTKTKKAPLWLEIVLGALAFILPFVVITILFTVNGFNLAGHSGKTVIMFDMQSQYISILKDYRNALLTGRSLVYTMNRTFGGDYLSIFCYYLASPFNLLSVFVKESDLPQFFAWTNIIKMTFASVNMYLLLRFSTKKINIGYLGFAFAYGLISYSVVEMHNFMWLDCVMILPLIILGMRYLEEGKFHWIYGCSLAYALLTSWYLGALVCIFVVIFFIYRYISIKTRKERISYIMRFGATSLCGGFVAAAFWFTALMHLAGTKATGSLPSTNEFFPISMFFSGLLTNNFESPLYLTIYSGYATMFTSVITLVFFQLFFLNKEFTLKERLAALGVFFVYFLAISSNVLNALFHGGQEPTWFPARYSFVIGFFICYIGALEFEKLEKTPLLALILPVVTGIAVPIIVTKVPNTYLASRGGEYYNLNVMGIILYIACLFLVASYLVLKKYKVVKDKILDLAMPCLIIVLTAISSTDGFNRVLKTYNKANYPQLYSTYLKDCEYQDGINKIKALEPYENYRMELLVNRPGNYNDIDNNPMFYSYPGLNHFSSNSKKEVQKYFQNLGYHNNTFFEKFDSGSTLSISSLLGLKYLIDDPNSLERNRPKYQQSYPFVQLDISSTDKELKFYKNEYAMPLGFVGNSMNGGYWIAEGEYRGDKIYWYDHFEYQNQIFKTFVSDVLDSENKQKDIFEPLEITSIELSNLTYTEDEWGHRKYSSIFDTTSQIKIKFKEPSSGVYNLYVCEKNLNEDYSSFYIDSTYTELANYWHKGIKGVNHSTSLNHTITFTYSKPIKDLEIIPELYGENIQTLEEYINSLKVQAANDLKPIKGRFKYGFEGTFKITKENQSIYFTLPYEKDFKIYIDGKAVKTELSWNIFTSAKLDNIPLGTHKVKIIYKDSAFVFGFVITNVGVGGLVGVILLDKKHKNKEKSKESQLS